MDAPSRFQAYVLFYTPDVSQTISLEGISTLILQNLSYGRQEDINAVILWLCFLFRISCSRFDEINVEISFEPSIFRYRCLGTCSWAIRNYIERCIKKNVWTKVTLKSRKRLHLDKAAAIVVRTRILKRTKFHGKLFFTTTSTLGDNCVEKLKQNTAYISSL